MKLRTIITLAAILMASLVAAEEISETYEAFKCPTDFGYFPHPNCWQFFQCNWGIPYVQTCANGTQWKQEIVTCDHITDCQRPDGPELPGEPSTVAPEEPATTETEVDVTTENDAQDQTTEAPVEPSTAQPVEPTQSPVEPSTEESEQTTQPPTVAPTSAPGFQCPTEFGYFPHPNCWQFIQCNWFIPYVQTCANGTQWRQEIVTCDHITDCQRPGGPTIVPPTNAPVEPTNAPVEPTEAPVEPTNAPVEPTNGPDDGNFKCPSESGYFPHKDCWRFWQCDFFVAHEMTCPKGTQWDQSILTCNHITDCKRPDGPTIVPPTNAPVEPTEAPIEPTNGPTDAPQEPTNAPVEPTTAEPVEPSTQEPEKPTTAEPTNPPTEAPTTTTEAPTTTSAPTTSTTTQKPDDDGSNFQCPERYGYYPHKDCYKFIQCGNYIPYVITCPKYTEWQQDILSCNYQTTCRRPDSPWPPVRPTEKPTEKPVSTTTTTTTTEAPAGFVCPDRYGYYPHKDCWKFWQCGNWISYEMTCPPYTQWDQRITTCRHRTTCNRPFLN